MPRLPREYIHMGTAISWSHRAMCSQDDRKVGAVITTSDMRRVLSFGYNGPGKGLPDDYCLQWRQSLSAADPNGVSRCPCLHAEDNAIAYVDSTIPDKILFVTLSPCETCAHRILNGNFKAVYFRKTYRSGAGVELLKRSRGLVVEQIDHSMLDEWDQLMRRFYQAVSRAK